MSPDNIDDLESQLIYEYILVSDYYESSLSRFIQVLSR